MKIEKSFSILLILSFTLQLFISSCTRKRDYDFLVINNTKYEINTLKIGCGSKDSKEISIEPNSEKKITYHNSGTYFDFTEPMLCLTVLKYSDTLKTYENTYGGVTSIKDLKKKKTNVMTIEIDPNPLYPTDIFDIKVN